MAPSGAEIPPRDPAEASLAGALDRISRQGSGDDISVAIAAWGVPRLRSLKLGQVIRQEGPQAHHGKAGTPTMGGLLVVPVGVLVGGWTSPGDPRLLAVAAVTLAYMAIGAMDDWRSLTKQTNTGLTPRGKLALQALAALVFLQIGRAHV